MLDARGKAEAASANLNAIANSLMRGAGLHWYVGMTPPQKEWRSHQALGDLHVPAYLATTAKWRRDHRQTKKRLLYRLPLLPRVLFLGFTPGRERFRDTLEAGGGPLTGFVSIAGIPARLPEQALLGFLQRVDDAAKITDPVPAFEVGDQVTVTDGPLAGEQVSVASIRGGKAQVLGSLLMTARSMEIQTQYLKRTET
jgi:hypothetical protein